MEGRQRSAPQRQPDVPQFERPCTSLHAVDLTGAHGTSPSPEGLAGIHRKGLDAGLKTAGMTRDEMGIVFRGVVPRSRPWLNGEHRAPAGEHGDAAAGSGHVTAGFSPSSGGVLPRMPSAPGRFHASCGCSKVLRAMSSGLRSSLAMVGIMCCGSPSRNSPLWMECLSRPAISRALT